MQSENFSNPNKMFSGQVNDETFRIKIVGVGGAGNNAVDRIKLDHLDEVDLAVVNTDSKVLSNSLLEEKVMIGREITRGLSAGGDADIGKRAAESDRDQLLQLVNGIDLVFIIAGLGGGTGSGAAPVLAEIAANQEALVIAFVTLPFTNEGIRRHNQAEESLAQLRDLCHAVVPLPNDILLQQVDENATVLDAFTLADEWIYRGVHSIWSMIKKTGLINVDFATLRNAFENRGGKTLFGLGYGEGENFVDKAFDDLKLCSLLHTPEFSKRADSLIVNVYGGTDLTMNIVNEIMTVVGDQFGSKENIVLGAYIDESMQQKLSITVLGTTNLDGVRRRYPSVKPAFEPMKQAQNPASTKHKEEHYLPAVHESKIIDQNNRKDSQEEFMFSSDEEQRGYFNKTDRNFYEGEDLDVPTYLRRGIKINF